MANISALLRDQIKRSPLWALAVWGAVAPPIALAAPLSSAQGRISIDGPTAATIRFTGADLVKAEFARAPEIPRTRVSMWGTPGKCDASQRCKAVSAKIYPDQRVETASYPTLTPLSEGVVIYGPSLKLEGRATKLSVEPRSGWTTLGDINTGFAFIGPSSSVSKFPSGEIACDRESMNDLCNLVEEITQKSLLYFGRKIYKKPYSELRIIVSQSIEKIPRSLEGHVSQDGVIFIIVNKELDLNDKFISNKISTLIYHEAFHIWNRRQKIEPITLNNRWLREGGAEYASMIATLDDEGKTRAFERHINACRSALQQRGLLSLPPDEANDTRYSCGATAMWVIDRTTMPDAQRSGVERILAKTLKRHPAGYSVQDFRNEVLGDSADASKALALLLEADNGSRWADLIATLQAKHVKIKELDAAPLEWVSATAIPLVKSACPEQFFGLSIDEAGKVRPDVVGCRNLRNDDVMLSVDGIPLSERRAFDHVREACGRRSSINLEVARGAQTSSISLSCEQEVATPASIIAIG